MRNTSKEIKVKKNRLTQRYEFKEMTFNLKLWVCLNGSGL